MTETATDDICSECGGAIVFGDPEDDLCATCKTLSGGEGPSENGEEPSPPDDEEKLPPAATTEGPEVDPKESELSGDPSGETGPSTTREEKAEESSPTTPRSETSDGADEDGGSQDALFDLDEFTEEDDRRDLKEDFLVPPFSVLDARKGYWQSRKNAWISLGIRSEIGRGTSNEGSAIQNQELVNERLLGDGEGPKDLDARDEVADSELFQSIQAADPGYYRKKRQVESELGEEITHEEFVTDHYERPDKGYTSGVSVFDPVLCELVYRWFAPHGGRVLDPCAGGSVRGVVASLLGREYTGIELREEQVEANRDQAYEILDEKGVRLGSEPAAEVDWVCGDGREAPDLVPDDEPPYDLWFTCPPYYDLEVYSDEPGELSARPTYEGFLDDYRDLIHRSVDLLADDRFAVIVVSEVRKSSEPKGYQGLVPDTIRIFEEAGLEFYNEAILVTMLGSLPMRARIPFETTRKIGRTHQNVLVFAKGSPRAAVDAIGEDVEHGGAVTAAGGSDE